MPLGRCCGWWNDWEQPRSSATLPARSRHHHPGIASSSKAPPAPPTHLAIAHSGTARGARAASAGPNTRAKQLRRRPRADDRGPRGGAQSAVGSGLESGPNESARVIRRGSSCSTAALCLAASALQCWQVVTESSFRNVEQLGLTKESKRQLPFLCPLVLHSRSSNFLHRKRAVDGPRLILFERARTSSVQRSTVMRVPQFCQQHLLYFRDSPYLQTLS